MRVLFVASEVYPLLKTGGLADVAGALPPALRELGVDVRLLLPGFPAILKGLDSVEKVSTLTAYPGARDVTLLSGRLPDSGVRAFVVDAPAFYDRPGNPYLGPDGKDWPDNDRRFALLGRAVLDVVPDIWDADVVHAHDWHAGLAPAYLAARRQDGSGPATPSVFTIHNLAFQGLFPYDSFAETGLPANFFALEGLEYWDQLSFMKAGLHFAERLSTVSPTYAREIQQPEQGMGMDGLLRHRARDLVGILNGVDYGVWNPEMDPAMPTPYSVQEFAPKATAKGALQKMLGLEPSERAPLFGVVSRLTEQKGLDLVLDALPWLIAKGGQLALLGTGTLSIERGFERIGKAEPERVGIRIEYDETLAHNIIGGSDVILVPSRFEPCGLTQLFGLRYGTLPLARRTGGLADSIVDATKRSLAEGAATGFLFERATATALKRTLARSLALYQNPVPWSSMCRRAMTRDFSWSKSAGRYLSLYQELKETAEVT